MKRKRVIIAGAGASGLAAAIEAARHGAEVTVLEGTKKPGQKLLRTGAGRCNLSNEAPPEGHYFGLDPDFAEAVFRRIPEDDLENWFRSAGIMTVSFSGWKYPASETAASVLSSLLAVCRRLGVRIKLNETVRRIEKSGQEFCVRTDGWSYAADAVILSCGSRAGVRKNDPDGYGLAQELGLRIAPPLPALVPLLASPQTRRACGSWDGVRAHAAASLLSDGEMIRREAGQVQFVQGGISGIAVFNLSPLAVYGLQKKKHMEVELDLAPSFAEDPLAHFLAEKIRRQGSPELLRTVIPDKLIPFVQAAAEEKILRWTDAASGAADAKRAEAYAAALKHFRLDVRGTKSFDAAQVSLGGIESSEINPGTMMTKKISSLFVTGEMLDIAGECGGFNLRFAFSTGILAGRSAVL